MDFSAYTSKLQKEQKSRAEKAKREAEKLAREKDRVAAKLAEYEEQQRLARIERHRIEEEAALVAERERELNGGVDFRPRTLRAVPYDAAEQKGINRSKDKICLPVSVRTELSMQGAEKLGPMFFELSRGGTRTHGAALEFTARDGTVGVPPALAAMLGGSEEEAVQVKFARLPKGTFARLQPVGRDFQRDVEDVRAVLERELHTRSSLTVGDVLDIDFCGTLYRLRVLELQPQPQVSVIDTDMEVEVAPSVEYEEEAAVKAAAAARQEAELAEHTRVQEERARLEQEETARALANAEAVHRQRLHKAAHLPPEPPAGAEGVVSCAVRMPDGARLVRRVLLGESLRVLFDFVDAKGTADLQSYSLATAFPRRVFTLAEDADKTLSEMGLDGPQLAFFLEAC
mmetsp:Transcript_4264/g.7878  ORF Transcript_4264/g.7878 Transcript_4264/m.7878 type:complete len:401 (+) Transcript_4264:347-1549(+)|eukprot:CAMPEP_0114236656 /NCGR_PEP_ID=MMETSP0058-20121206/6961_1 /TAXON_ID=36894 /ORGANISM="Pyramimonas parkeae, CCMP726" /LENGTH=400 /DNA_ID=CAMNT_0001348621 /DNA_START=298 /DNA_END=1500 /DNA_ORIENTATION=+